MNSLLILFNLLTVSPTHEQIVPDTTQYIEIVRTGNSDKTRRSVFISKSKFDIQLEPYEVKELKLIQEKVPKFTKEFYVQTHYKALVTDAKTYASVFVFVEKHNEYYETEENENHGSEQDMAIFVGRKRYSIYYKFSGEFFNELIAYLKSKGCDKTVIEALSEA